MRQKCQIVGMTGLKREAAVTASRCNWTRMAPKLLAVDSPEVGNDPMRRDTIASYPLIIYQLKNRKNRAFFTHRYDENDDLGGSRGVPHRHDFFELIWLTEGAGRLTCDLKTWTFEPGTLFFAAPGRTHCWQSTATARGYVFGFKNEYLQPGVSDPGSIAWHLELNLSEKPLLTLAPEHREEMTQLFSTLAREADRQGSAQDCVVRNYGLIILTKVRQWLELAATGAGRQVTAQHSLVGRFRQCVAENVPKIVKVGDYAKLLRTSRSQLNRKVNEQIGTTASRVIHDRLLLEAQRLLLHSESTVSEIAYSLHFVDPSYFGRFFRRRQGVTPAEYRRRARNHVAELQAIDVADAFTAEI